MSQNLQGLSFEEAIAYIEENYVGRVLAYLRGDQKRVVNNKQYMEVFSLVVHQCDVEDKNAQLHAYYEETCIKYIQKELRPFLVNQTGQNMLDRFVTCWEKFTTFSKCMEKMFEYLNRFYLKNLQRALLGEQNLRQFKEGLFDAFKKDFLHAILDQISSDRKREQINRELLKKALRIYVDLGLIHPKPMKTPEGFTWEGDRSLSVYDDEFEVAFLGETQQEFEKRAHFWSQSKNCPEYLQEVEQALAHEEANADYWLQQETKGKMLKIVENELITRKAEAIVEKDTGAVNMFQNSKLDELALLYKIFKRDEDTLSLIIRKMNPYIVERGNKIVEDETLLKDPIAFTNKLLEFKAEMDKMVETSFSNQLNFQRGRDTSFEDFMNGCNYTPSYIAIYADKELKGGLKGASDDEVNARLDAIIRLFVCLHSRDNFILQYQKNLSERLLNKTSISQEAETEMLQKLKVECGMNQVNKMTQMFKDIRLSQDQLVEFREQNKGSNIDGVEFSVEVLTQGTWPAGDQSKCSLPAPMKSCTAKFSDWYKQKNHNRQLTWNYAHGSVEIMCLHTSKKYQLIVNVFQAAILCLFNSHNEVTTKDIKRLAEVPEEHFMAAMQKFCHPKMLLLLKEEKKNPVFKPDEKIVANEKFSSQNIRVNLQPTKSTKKKTVGKTDEEMKQDRDLDAMRRLAIQSALVKIMKSKKNHRFMTLQGDCLEMITQFKAVPAMVKEQIEDLIKREILARDENDRTMIEYVP